MKTLAKQSDHTGDLHAGVYVDALLHLLTHGRLILQRTSLFVSKCQAIISSRPILVGVARIFVTSSSQKISRTSQPPVAGSMSSQTFESRTLPLGVIGLRVTPQGIHGSSHIRTCMPSPTRQIRPLSSQKLLHSFYHETYSWKLSSQRSNI